jgi:diadenosine tetraphosphate (Ap4A) HIT family hydrolase
LKEERGVGETLIHKRVAMARAGENPYVICRVGWGWVVAGDAQVVEAYCLLLPDPVVGSINDLSAVARSGYLSDVVAIGDVLLRLEGVRRINYEILGNLEPALHAHVVARWEGESAELRTKPVWAYDWDAARRFDPERDGWWVERVREGLASERPCGPIRPTVR